VRIVGNQLWVSAGAKKALVGLTIYESVTD
jgi:hypothetical protein